jgi:hypothetical protein
MGLQSVNIRKLFARNWCQRADGTSNVREYRTKAICGQCRGHCPHALWATLRHLFSFCKKRARVGMWTSGLLLRRPLGVTSLCLLVGCVIPFSLPSLPQTPPSTPQRIRRDGGRGGGQGGYACCRAVHRSPEAGCFLRGLWVASNCRTNRHLSPDTGAVLLCSACSSLMAVISRCIFPARLGCIFGSMGVHQLCRTKRHWAQILALFCCFQCV